LSFRTARPMNSSLTTTHQYCLPIARETRMIKRFLIAITISGLACSQALGAGNRLIVCKNERKVYFGVVDTTSRQPQRLFGHDMIVTEENNFIRGVIMMPARTFEILISRRSGALSYDNGEADPYMKCEVENLPSAKHSQSEPISNGEFPPETPVAPWYIDSLNR
jgi:hypothetical protein